MDDGVAFERRPESARLPREREQQEHGGDATEQPHCVQPQPPPGAPPGKPPPVVLCTTLSRYGASRYASPKGDSIIAGEASASRCHGFTTAQPDPTRLAKQKSIATQNVRTTTSIHAGHARIYEDGAPARRAGCAGRSVRPRLIRLPRVGRADDAPPTPRTTASNTSPYLPSLPASPRSAPAGASAPRTPAAARPSRWLTRSRSTRHECQNRSATQAEKSPDCGKPRLRCALSPSEKSRDGRSGQTVVAWHFARSRNRSAPTRRWPSACTPRRRC